MRTITLEGMYFYAYHGYYEEERQIGNHYYVDVMIDTPSVPADKEINLQNTVDYSTVYDLVRDQMQVSCHLLEQVAQRIINSFEQEFEAAIEQEAITGLKVKVIKCHPPVEGYVEKATVTLEKCFED